MASRQYRPGFEKQLTGTPCGPANCNMAAAAVFADRQTLGLVQKTPDQMRTLSGTAGECTDNIPGNDGTNMANAATALSRVGITLVIRDDIDMPDVWAALDIRKGAIAHGDYDRVPIGLRGDREFLGFHSVYLNEHDRANRRILVYDGLDDGRADRPTGRRAPVGPIWWPDSVVAAYMAAFPGGPLTAGFTTLQYVAPSVPVANVRSGPSRARAVISRAVRRERDRHEYGGIVTGERIAGDARWFRVWVSELNPPRIGYMHASVARPVTI